MEKIIKFEFDKLFRQKSFYVCTIIVLGLTLLSAVSTNVMLSSELGATIAKPDGWSYAASAVSNSQLMMILGIFTAMFVCSEYDENTLKNIYSRGYGRIPVYIGKYISSFVAMTIMFAASTVVSFCAASALWGTGNSDGYLRSIICQFVVLIGYHALFYVISVILGKTGGSIAFNIVAPMIVSMLLSIADGLLNIDSFKFGNYWLDSFLATAQNSAAETNQIILCVVASFIYTVVLFSVGITINKKKQL